MTPEQVFSLANGLALAAWVALVFFGRRAVVGVATARAVPMALAIVYCALIASQFGASEGGFGTLAEVAALFRNPWVLLAGWIHYLAFDLFVGSWEVRDAARLGIPQWQVAPCLVLTFLFGPAGWLLYQALRYQKARRADGARLAME